MSEDLFDTEQKRETAIAAFQGLLEHPGWKLVVKIMDMNIEFLRTQLEDGIEGEETKADVDRTRDKLKLMREMRNTPQDQIKKLTAEEQEVPNPDPYSDTKNDNESDLAEET
jgi:hypothetical protein